MREERDFIRQSESRVKEMKIACVVHLFPFGIWKFDRKNGACANTRTPYLIHIIFNIPTEDIYRPIDFLNTVY